MNLSINSLARGVGLASTIAVLLLSIGCEGMALRAEERRQERLRQHQAKIEQVYDASQGLAHYTVPTVTFQIKKEELTLDLWKHISNDAKAQRFTVPVSQDYQNSLSIGQVMSMKDNATGFILRGEFSRYVVSVAAKGDNDLYCSIQNDSCSELNELMYAELLTHNEEAGDLELNGADLYIREGANVPDQFSRTCDVRIESKKSNFTLDLGKHFENDANNIHYDVQVPGFICEQLREGEVIRRQGVSGSLFLSSSPSSITYTVKNVTWN